MIKKNKLKLIISSLIILLPIVAGLVMWNILPEQMTTHWGIDGQADGWSSRFFAVFAPPLFMLLAHWLCIFVTLLDPKNKDQNKKAFGMVFWICPIASLFASAVVYATAFGMELNMEIILLILIGLMLVVIGNYLPKCKQNYTLGIKVKWTLENEKNWNATHRMAGKLWVVCGLLLMACAFLPKGGIPYALSILLTVIAAVPIVYSYAYHRKQLKEGTATTNTHMSKHHKRNSRISLIFALVIFLFVGVILFTGNIEILYDDTSFTIEASYWDDLAIDYAEIESIEYREQDTPGTRTNGFGSPRLLMGAFQNDEFGHYTRYSYTKSDSCIVLIVDGETLVISGTDNESTKEIYDELKLKVEK